MLKKIIVAVIAFQMIVVPVQAETDQPKKTQCTQGFMGVDDAIFLSVMAMLALKGFADVMKILKRRNVEAEQTKPEAKQTPVCQL